MSKILNFLIRAIKWLSKPIAQIKSSSPEEKYVPLELALAAIDLSYAYWVSLYIKYKEVAKLKRIGSLKELHLRAKAAMAKYEELDGFDLANGNPYLHLIASHAMTRDELAAKVTGQVVVINTKLLERLTEVILTYNFFKIYRERAGDLFNNAESEMRNLVESHKLPGRFSWNNFVERVVKEKTEQDFTFLNEYGTTAIADDDSQPKDEKKAKEEPTGSPEGKSSDDQSGGKAQDEPFQGLD